MRAVVEVLAILGFVAVLWRLGRAGARALGRTAERVAAGHAVGTRAQRGDLTGMAEADAWHRRAGRQRWWALLACAGWLALLIVPAYTPWTRLVYAACAVLWLVDLLPRRHS